MRREVRRQDWEEFLRAFTQTYQGRRARIEVTAPLGEGGPLFEAYEPLRSVTLKPDGDEVPEIMIALGDGGTPHLVHGITDPARIWIEEDLHGIDLGLEIASAEGDETLLCFEAVEALPERGATAAGMGGYRGRDRLPPERV
jgi:hypothetical protein